MEPQPALGWSGTSPLGPNLTGPLLHHPLASLAFANAFGDVTPIEVPAWDALVLARDIPDSGRKDAAGCYPFVPLALDADLKRGLDQLRQLRLVSMVFVTDPFHMPANVERLREAFDVCRPFKTHYVFDRRLGDINRSHPRWRRVQIAREALDIREVPYADHIPTWARLYGNLVENHGISGTTAFDEAFFGRLAAVPGLRAVAGFLDGDIVSVMIFVVHGDIAYSFLAGTSPEGRRRCAHYGLYAEAIERFTDVTIVNLGGVPGFVDDPKHGIAHMKQKLTNTTRQSFICGSVLDQAAYRSLGGDESVFFPAYRAAPSRVTARRAG